MSGIWIVEGSEHLKAEVSHNFNLSAEYTKGHYNYTASLYYNKVKNKLSTSAPYFKNIEDKLPYLPYTNLDSYSVSLAYIIIVLILHVFASRENASAYSSAYPVILCEVMIVVETDVYGVLAGWDVLVVDGVAVLVLRQLFVGVGVSEACRQTVVPSSLGSQFAATNTILAEIL